MAMFRIGKSRLLRSLALGAASSLLCGSGIVGAPGSGTPSKQKLHGYVTARIDGQTIAILDDQIQLPEKGKIVSHENSGEHTIASTELKPGMLIQAEGIWTAHHRFAAERVDVDAGLLEKQIRNSSYLQEEPTEATKIKNGEPAELLADGERLLLNARTKREWAVASPALADSNQVTTSVEAHAFASTPASGAFLGYRVSYNGVRQPDGRIAAERVELGSPAPPEAYKIPHGMEVVRANDPQTGIDIVEFRRGKRVDGRLKLFADKATREYVSQLGDSLIPAGAKGTTKAIEFRFLVIEDPSVNASALPDGTILIHTGLLGAIENESQLAFVLSHEMAHVLQAHYWREVRETRAQRISLLIAGTLASAYIGDVGVFLSEIGMASVVNGHQRELENQADRLGLQNIIEHGYDPRTAVGFMNIIVERYGSRSTSKIWSNHDSSLLRGSFLTVQLLQQYPERHFEGARVDTPAFQAMRESMGPVKID